MKQLTLRDIPEDVEKEIRKIARKSGTSINKTVQRLLREALGIEHPIEQKRDLSDFARIWNEEEATEFKKATAGFEEIDEELWK